MGGFDGEENLMCCEAYDIEKDEWKFKKWMHVRR